MEHGILLDLDNRDTWRDFLCKSKLAWLVVFGAGTSLYQFGQAEFANAVEEGLEQAASNTYAIAVF